MLNLFAEWATFTKPQEPKPLNAVPEREPRGNVHDRYVRPDGIYYRVQGSDIVVKHNGTIRRTVKVPDGAREWEAQQAVLWGFTMKSLARTCGVSVSKVAIRLRQRSPFTIRRDW